MTVPDTMREFAIVKIAGILEDVTSAIQAAANNPDMETVHKMRVAIRRFQQGLRLFRSYVRKNGADQIKQELREIMQIAGELRNYDIAIELIGKNHGKSHVLTEPLKGKRSGAQQRLSDIFRPYAKRDLSSKWRSKLGLEEA